MISNQNINNANLTPVISNNKRNINYQSSNNFNPQPMSTDHHQIHIERNSNPNVKKNYTNNNNASAVLSNEFEHSETYQHISKSHDRPYTNNLPTNNSKFVSKSGHTNEHREFSRTDTNLA